ncbi:MAG: hypothetical protein NTZ04_04200 [Chloroflexi bacterium]|nr:hypothetical protein [Chloroflexota bacterium]
MGHGIPQTKSNKPALASYYLPDVKPLIHCGACLTVVLEKSQEARGIYAQLVESYALPDIKAAFKKLECELPPHKVMTMWKENVEDLRIRQSENKEEPRLLVPDTAFLGGFNDKASGYSYVFQEWFNLDREQILSPDFRQWYELINTLIRVGFNRKSDRDAATYKVTGEKSQLLFFVIHMRAFAEYGRVGVVNDDKVKAIMIDGAIYDLTTLLGDRPTTRRHRLRTESYRQAGYRLLHHHKVERSAMWWYQSRVVYSGPEDFWWHEWSEESDLWDWPNLSNAIKPCDEALGYPRGT